MAGKCKEEVILKIITFNNPLLTIILEELCINELEYGYLDGYINDFKILI